MARVSPSPAECLTQWTSNKLMKSKAKLGTTHTLHGAIFILFTWTLFIPSDSWRTFASDFPHSFTGQNCGNLTRNRPSMWTKGISNLEKKITMAHKKDLLLVHLSSSRLCDVWLMWYLKFLAKLNILKTFFGGRGRCFPHRSWIKNLPAMQETWVQFLSWEDSLEKRMTTHSSMLAWEIPWTEEPGCF